MSGREGIPRWGQECGDKTFCGPARAWLMITSTEKGQAASASDAGYPRMQKVSNPGPRERHAVSTPQKAHGKKDGLGCQLLRAPRRVLQQIFLLPAHLNPCQADGAGAPGETQVPILLLPCSLLLGSSFTASPFFPTEADGKLSPAGKGSLQHGRGRGQEMFTPPGYGDSEGKIPETPKLGHVELAMQGAARTSQLPLPTKNSPGPWSSMSSLPKIQ